MEKLNKETNLIMNERFGKDSLISLATSIDNHPHVRIVDALYINGSFYVITYQLSNKMKQINKNNEIAICGDWFTAVGYGINHGYFCKPENKELALKLRKAFIAWIDNGHNNFNDENTIILEIKLTSGILYANNHRYNIDFTNISEEL